MRTLIFGLLATTMSVSLLFFVENLWQREGMIAALAGEAKDHPETRHPDPLEITGGPYLQLVTPTNIVIRWRTSEPIDSVVYYGMSPDNLFSTLKSAALTKDHEVEVTGLRPATRYYYSVASSSLTLAGGSSSYTFLTAPKPGTVKPTRIWAFGDSGTARFSPAAVRDAYKQYSGVRHTDLWLMLGDNAYSSGTDDQYQDAVFDMYPELLRKIVLWPTLGNHDARSVDVVAQTGPYFDVFTLPTKGEAGGVASGTEAYYAFDYGNIHFVSLDTTKVLRARDHAKKIGSMLSWLEMDLAANNKEWIIAYWHHPTYSRGAHYWNSDPALDALPAKAAPILERYGVDLVLSGHSHSYERSFFLDGHYGRSDTLTASMIIDSGDGRVAGDGAYKKPRGSGTPQEGAVYMVVGTGGATEGGPLNHPAMYISLNTLGSLVIDVFGNRLDAVFIDDAGVVRDTFTIENGPDKGPPQIIGAESVDAKTVLLLFAEPLDPASAETVSNYAIDNGGDVLTATLGRNLRRVSLTTAPLIEGRAISIAINNVRDLAGNTIAPIRERTLSPTSRLAGTFKMVWHRIRTI